MALTGKKKAFADSKKAGKSNKDAALAAGYSVKTAGPAGSRLAKDKDVLAYLKRVAKIAAPVAGFSEQGVKCADAPTSWPFGTQPPAAPPAENKPVVLTARAYLSSVVNDETLDEKMRVDAAKKLIEFEEAKPAPQGKKDQKKAGAEKVASKFAPAVPPRLAVVGGKKG